MNILAVDCCLKITGIALMIDDEIDFESHELGRKQSQELPLITQKIMSRNNLEWNNLDYVALTNGPGYFTGIRVGAAYACGVAFSCSAKIIPVSSLELLCASCEINHKKILSLVYAGHGYVYGYSKNFLEPNEYSHDEIISWTKNNPDSLVISDDKEKINIDIDMEIMNVRPRIEKLCELAKENINQALNPMELKILYYRAPQGMN